MAGPSFSTRSTMSLLEFIPKWTVGFQRSTRTLKRNQPYSVLDVLREQGIAIADSNSLHWVWR